MVHDKRIRYLHRSAIVIQLQYTIGLKSSSTRLKGGELIITFLRFAVVFGDWNWTAFFLLVSSSRGTLWFNTFSATWNSPN